MADELPNDLIPVGPQKELPADLIPAAPQAPVWHGPTADTLATQGTMGQAMHAFGQGFQQQWGASNTLTDLASELKKYDYSGSIDVGKAFNEAFVRPAINAMDLGYRTLSGGYQAVYDASIELGHPFDAAAAGMEAFPLFGAELGGLKPFTGKTVLTGGKDAPVDLRVAKDMEVVGPRSPSINEGTPAQAAAATVRPIVAYHGSPYSFDAFKSEAIGTGEGAQSYGHGLYFAEQPEVAKQYVDQGGGSLPAAMKGTPQYEEWLAKQGTHYQARIHANKDDFLDWDKPLEDQPAGRLLLDKIEPDFREKLEDDIESRGGGGDLGNYTGGQVHKWLENYASEASLPTGASDNPLFKSDVTKYLQDKGIPGIKYLDQGSRLVQERPRAAPDGQWEVAWNTPNRQLFKTYDEASAYAKQLMEAPTHNLVVFSDKDVEITHKNGVPVASRVPAVQDQALMAQAEPKVPANPVDADPWNARFAEWVQKLQVPEDVKNLITNAAQHNQNFPEAREGQASAVHLGALSDATGIPLDQLPEAKLRQEFRTDAEFHTAAKLMVQTNDDVFEAARQHKGEGTFETRKNLVAAIMRRDIALERVLGLRAEWGRTGNVMQEFLDSTKDAQSLGRFIKDKKGEGWNSAKLDEIADQLAGQNSREGVASLLTAARKPSFVERAVWDWTNSILSGLLTHTKYVFANAAYLGHDTLIATPLAGVSGAIRQALSKEEIERVYVGEAAAKMVGLINAVPDALYAAGRAVKTGIPTPLPAQLKGAGRVNPITGLEPIQGLTGAAAGKVAGPQIGAAVNTAIGTPSRVIAGIHSFFNFLGYRAEIEAQAYRKAAKTNSPLNRQFWDDYLHHSTFPDDPMMDAAIEAGQRANFVQELGPIGKKMQSLAYETQVGRFILPFLRVPGNIANALQEGSLLAFLPGKWGMLDQAKKGGAALDTFNGRVAGGAAIMGYAAYLTLQDKLTDNGPIDPTQRAEWLLTHQPNSYQQDGKWVSYDRFGPVGGWLALSSAITAAGRHAVAASQDGRLTETERKRADADLGEAASRVVLGFTKYSEEAGFQGLFDFVEAMNDPQKTRAASGGATAATALPFSSFNAQLASWNDPYLRETQTFVDGIKNRLEGARQSLPYVRDWSGAPRPNPMYHTLVKQQEINTDPVDLEMQRLNLKPTRVPDEIKGVKLTQDQYNDYQDHAGIATRSALHQLVSEPNWQNIPAGMRTKLILGQIAASRRQAEAYMQPTYPNLIGEGIENRFNSLTAGRPKPESFVRP